MPIIESVRLEVYVTTKNSITSIWKAIIALPNTVIVVIVIV